MWKNQQTDRQERFKEVAGQLVLLFLLLLLHAATPMAIFTLLPICPVEATEASATSSILHRKKPLRPQLRKVGLPQPPPPGELTIRVDEAICLQLSWEPVARPFSPLPALNGSVLRLHASHQLVSSRACVPIPWLSGLTPRFSSCLTFHSLSGAAV